MSDKTITVKLIKSVIGANQRQRATIRALGLRRLHATATLPENPAILGMLEKVGRWLEIKR